MEDKITLKDGTIIEGVDEIPVEHKIFSSNQIEYTTALTGNILLNDLKGQLLNIIEGIGLPIKQETAVKRMVTNCLHDAQHNISESLELVKNPLDAFYSSESKVIIPGHPELEKRFNELLSEHIK